MQTRITELINGYQIEFPDEHLVAKVSRLRIPSDGQVKGELEITQTRDGTPTYLLVPTMFNFSSEPTRAKYAKDLAAKLAVKVEWKEILDYLAYKVQELARAGAPLVEVYPDRDAPAPEQLLEGLLYEGVQNIIFGKKGAAKSTLAYTLGLCVALPWRDNPFHLSVSSRSIKGLVLDWETDETIFRYYMGRLQRGMNIPPCSLHYRHCTLPLMADVEEVQAHIEACGAEFLIIDSLAAAAGGERGELKGSESALLFNAALRKLRRTSLIIAQTAKGGDDDSKKTIFGSTIFTYYARNIFELCVGEDAADSVQHLGLLHRDCNLGPKMRPIGLRLEYQDGGGIAIERESFSVSEFAEKVSASARILDILKDGKMSQKDLKESLDASYQTIGQALKRLSQQGKVLKIGNEWGLVAQ